MAANGVKISNVACSRTRIRHQCGSACKTWTPLCDVGPPNHDECFEGALISCSEIRRQSLIIHVVSLLQSTEAENQSLIKSRAQTLRLQADRPERDMTKMFSPSMKAVLQEVANITAERKNHGSSHGQWIVRWRRCDLTMKRRAVAPHALQWHSQIVELGTSTTEISYYLLHPLPYKYNVSRVSLYT